MVGWKVALYQRILNHGYQGHKARWDAFGGQRYAVVRDPDDNVVDLFAAREAST